MAILAEILDTLAWYRPLESIETDEGILVTKISNDEVILICEGQESRWIRPSESSPFES